jgi:hypothetical protein
LSGSILILFFRISFIGATIKKNRRMGNPYACKYTK